ncbi:MAG TPA: hypothetical protein VJ960_09380, partial [Oceanipulchritudo sp.]|nr:hypothetical protein [Oceanipulchritudo sp.]
MGREKNDAEKPGANRIEFQPQFLLRFQGRFFNRPVVLAILRILEFQLFRAAIRVGLNEKAIRRPGLLIVEPKYFRFLRTGAHAGPIAAGNPASVTHP